MVSELSITGCSIKAKRAGAGIAGVILCKKVGIARNRLTDIERGYTMPSSDEFRRIDAALDELIVAKGRMEAVGAEFGWPAAGAVT